MGPEQLSRDRQSLLKKCVMRQHVECTTAVSGVHCSDQSNAATKDEKMKFIMKREAASGTGSFIFPVPVSASGLVNAREIPLHNKKYGLAIKNGLKLDPPCFTFDFKVEAKRAAEVLSNCSVSMTVAKNPNTISIVQARFDFVEQVYGVGVTPLEDHPPGVGLPEFPEDSNPMLSVHGEKVVAGSIDDDDDAVVNLLEPKVLYRAEGAGGSRSSFEGNDLTSRYQSSVEATPQRRENRRLKFQKRTPEEREQRQPVANSECELASPHTQWTAVKVIGAIQQQGVALPEPVSNNNKTQPSMPAPSPPRPPPVARAAAAALRRQSETLSVAAHNQSSFAGLSLAETKLFSPVSSLPPTTTADVPTTATKRPASPIKEQSVKKPTRSSTRSRPSQYEKFRQEQAKEDNYFDEVGKLCPHQVVVKYVPKDPSAMGISVTPADFKCLRGSEFLNDVVINFYSGYLFNTSEDTSLRDRIFVFSTFFWKRLEHTDANKLTYANVRKWTRNVAVFDKDVLIVPINEDCHWSAMVVVHPRTLFEPQAGVTPAFLYFDSMGGYKFEAFVRLKKYLQLEWADKHLKETSPAILEPFATKPLHLAPDVPQQSNCHDCGVFMLEYIERLLHEIRPGQTLSLWKPNWKFSAKHITDKRQALRKILLDMAQTQNPAVLFNPPDEDVINIDDDDDDDDESEMPQDTSGAAGTTATAAAPPNGGGGGGAAAAAAAPMDDGHSATEAPANPNATKTALILLECANITEKANKQSPHKETPCVSNEHASIADAVANGNLESMPSSVDCSLGASSSFVGGPCGQAYGDEIPPIEDGSQDEIMATSMPTPMDVDTESHGKVMAASGVTTDHTAMEVCGDSQDTPAPFAHGYSPPSNSSPRQTSTSPEI